MQCYINILCSKPTMLLERGGGLKLGKNKRLKVQGEKWKRVRDNGENFILKNGINKNFVNSLHYLIFHGSLSTWSYSVQRVLESKSVVVGGGCVEAALSIYLENFATSLSSREQLAIADFAKSLLVIPKVTFYNNDFVFMQTYFSLLCSTCCQSF